MLYKQTDPVQYGQIVTRLQPDAEELKTALASLLSDALLSETQLPDGARQYTVNMNDEDYRMFFIQELIAKMFDGSSTALIHYMASRGMVKLEGGSYRPIQNASEYCTAGPEDRAALESAINKGDRQL